MGLTLTAPDLLQRITEATPYSMERGEILFHAGEICERVFYLCRGVVKLAFLRDDGTEKIITFLGPGSYLGESGVFCGQPEAVTAIAARPTELVALTREGMDRLLSTNPEVCRQLISSLTQKIGVITGELESACLRSAHSRVAYALHRLGCWGADDADGHRLIEYRVTHEELARMAGTCRVTVTNVLAGLRRQGIIDQRRAAIVIKDPVRLVQWAT